MTTSVILAADRDYASTGGSAQRLSVLIAFLVFAITSGYAWLMFAPIEEAMMAAYSPSFTTESINLLGSWQPIVFLVLTAPAMWLLAKRGGLIMSMRIGAAAELLGVSLKITSLLLNPNVPDLPLPSFMQSGIGPSYPLSDISIQHCVSLLNVGQALSAVSSPVSIGAPPLLSAQWFHDEQRTRATAAGVLANNFGNTVVYIAAPLLVALATDNFGWAFGTSVVPVVLVELVLALAAFVLVMRLPSLDPGAVHGDAVDGHISGGVVVSPQTGKRTESGFVPRPAPSGAFEQMVEDDEPSAVPIEHDSEYHHHPRHPHHHVTATQPVAAQAMNMFTIPSSVLIMLIFMWTSGAYIAWTALFDDLLLAMHAGLSNQFIGYMSFVSNAAYLVAGVLSSIVDDVCFPRRMKVLLLLCCIGSAAVTLEFSQTIPALPHAMHDDGEPAHNQQPCAYYNETAYSLILSARRHHHHIPHPYKMLKHCGPRIRHLTPRITDVETTTGARVKLLLLSAGSGFFSGAAAPLFYELLAEVTYPNTSEGVSGIVLSLWENIGSLIMFQLAGTVIPKERVSEAFAFGIVLCVGACLLIQERYKRWEASVAAGEVSDDEDHPPANERTQLAPSSNGLKQRSYGGTA